MKRSTLSSLGKTENQRRGKRSWRVLIIVTGVAVVLISAAAIYFVGQKDNESNGNSTPTIALGIDAYVVSKTSENDALFNVTIRNHADSSETGLLVCRITPIDDSRSFYSNLTISMYPNETRTVQITVDVPADAVWAPVIPSSQVDCYFA